MHVLETRYFSISGGIISNAEFPSHFEVTIKLFWDDKPSGKVTGTIYWHLVKAKKYWIQ